MKKIYLRINKKQFLDWYFDSEVIKDTGIDVYEKLRKIGEYKINLQLIWKSLGYIPINLIKNKKAINKKDIIGNMEIEEPAKLYFASF